MWCELGRFWTSDAPFKAKRNAFIGSVQGAALSGITSYTLSKNEKKKLDSKLLGLLRCMLEGAAYDSIAGTSLTNCEVYARWRLLPVERELLVREVK